MKFAVISPHYGYINRGVEITVRELVKRFRKKGHKVDIIGLGSQSDIKIKGLMKSKGIGKISDQFAEKTMFGGFMRHYIGLTPHTEDLVFSLKMYDKLNGGYDFIWSEGEIWEAIACNKFRKETGTPYIVSFNGPTGAMMKKEAQLLSDVFIVLTPEMKEWVQKEVPKCNVVQITHGVDTDFFNPYVKPLFDINKYEHPIIASTSALVKGKNIDLIIKAMKDRGSLFVTSDGPIKNRIVKMGKEIMGDRFHYLGVIPFEDLPKLYTASDALILATKNEPYGTVLLEAMACNIPVITRRDKTREWMVGEGGVLLEDFDELKKIVRDIHWRDWQNRPREQAVEFDWSRTVKEYEQVMKSI